MLSGVLHKSGVQSLWCAKHTSFFTVCEVPRDYRGSVYRYICLSCLSLYIAVHRFLSIIRSEGLYTLNLVVNGRGFFHVSTPFCLDQ